MAHASWTYGQFMRIRPTFLESWPTPLLALALPHVHLRLTPMEAAALATSAPLWRERLAATDPAGLHTIAAKLQQALETAEQGIFVRLGSGSPKDSTLFRYHHGCARTAVMALKFLQTSPRTRAHLSRLIELEHPIHLFVRRWRPIHPYQEFRCFMRDRRLAGISQIAHQGDEPDYPFGSSAEGIKHTLQAFFVRVAQACHLASAVFDVLYEVSADAGEPPQIRLLDANPWGPSSDACLFDWEKPEEFDGSFRYLK